MRLRTSLIMAILALCLTAGTAPRRQTTMAGKLKSAGTDTESVATPPTDTLTTDRLHDIVLSGYDKPIQATRETFFVTNNSPRQLISLTVTFTYTDTAGRLLHKATHTVNCDIPAGQTRAVSVPSWDRQHSFYYCGSTEPRRRSAPYRISHTISHAKVR